MKMNNVNRCVLNMVELIYHFVVYREIQPAQAHEQMTKISHFVGSGCCQYERDEGKTI